MLPGTCCTETPAAFKDRMVGYDRESAKRTQVLDDQSDYFDVDSNAWLSAEVRQPPYHLLAVLLQESGVRIGFRVMSCPKPCTQTMADVC